MTLVTLGDIRKKGGRSVHLTVAGDGFITFRSLQHGQKMVVQQVLAEFQCFGIFGDEQFTARDSSSACIGGVSGS